MTSTLILYYSRDGHTRRMANQIARGVSAIDGSEAVIRTVPELTTEPNTTESKNRLTERSASEIQTNDAIYVTKDELATADALIVGSPTRFGNMAAPLKAFFDTTSDLWLSVAMTDKPAAVFTSSSTLHGGQESTLFTMMLPLLHHGMIMVGLPYTEPALHHTRSGGTPYGASQVSGDHPTVTLTADEKALCIALGRRVASLAVKLKDNR